MRLTVSSIPESGIKEALKLPVPLKDRLFKEDARVSFKASRFDDRVLINGRAESVVSLECSRCLKNISIPVNISFDAEYIPYRESEEAEEHELANNELDVSFYRNDEIEIGDMIMEHMLLAIPMKPLCEPGCKGICRKCGKNLNKSLCECSTEETDPRLAPLKQFKEYLKNKRS